RPCLMSAAPDECQDAVGVVGMDEGDHADAHVEHAIEFLLLDAAPDPDELEDGWDVPRPFSDDDITARRQDSWEVVDESAAGDVSERADGSVLQRNACGTGGSGRRAAEAIEASEQLLNDGTVTDVDLQQFVPEGAGELGDTAARLELEFLKEDAAGE